MSGTSDVSVSGQEEHGQLRKLELASLLEATTLVTLVLIAVPLKHIAGWPLGVRVMGPVHGIVFMFYLWTVVQTVAGGNWRPVEVTRLVIVAFVPFMGFLNIAWLRRRRVVDLSPHR